MAHHQEDSLFHPSPHPFEPPRPPPSKAYIGLILAGIILILVSGIVLSLIYVANESWILTAGVMLNETGIALLAMGLIWGAIKDDSLHHHTRLAMIIGMAIVIAYLHLKMVTYYPGYYY